MKSTGQTEEFVYQAVVSGEIQIRKDGSIWRVAIERRNRWNDQSRMQIVEPRRIDGAMSAGYRLVKIMRHGKQVTTGAHRLVWRHFEGKIPVGLTINHKNGNRADNRPSNLELATYSDQQQHSMHVLKTAKCVNQDGEKNHAAKLTEQDVRRIRLLRANGMKLREIGEVYGIGYKAVSKIVLRQRWAHVE